MESLPWLAFLLFAAPAGNDDELIIIDDEPVAAVAGDAEEIIIEDAPAPAPAVAKLPARRAQTLVKSGSDSAVSVDTTADRAAGGAPEDFFEGWTTYRLHITHKPEPGRGWRVGARLRLWGGLDHPDEGGAGKTVLLTELTELRYDRRFGRRLVLQAGLQKVDWSVTDGMGPSVMFAPQDLRLGLAADPQDMSLPVEAFMARYTLSFQSDSYLEIAFVPRHRPAELRLWGSDWGMASPQQASALPMGDIAWLIDPSVEDYWQTNLLYLARPELKPDDFSGALRLRGRLRGTELGVWAFYGFDRFPEFRMDPDLALMLGTLLSFERPISEMMGEPGVLEAIQRLQGKMIEARSAGDPSRLITSVFHRLFQLGAQARRSIGPLVLAVETAWTPRFAGGRVLFSPSLAPISGLATLHTAAQVEYQRSQEFIMVLGLSDFWVPDVAAQPLMLLDSGFIGADGSLQRPLAPSSAHLIQVTAALKARVYGAVEILIAALGHPLQKDWLARPTLIWRLDEEKEQLRLGAELFAGPATSIFGQFSHNNRIVLGYKRRY